MRDSVERLSGIFFRAMNSQQQSYRCGYVTLVGAPNVGKSTLMNALLGQKLSIVTRKPQTTRHRILGILSNDSSQIIFVDTPGLLTPRYLLHEAMMESAGRALDDADVVLMLTEAGSDSALPDDQFAKVLERMKGKPLLLALTKIDRIDKGQIPALVDRQSSRDSFAGIVPVSGTTGENLETLLEMLRSALPIHPPYYPQDALTEHPERFFAAEIIREKIFDFFQEEIPYSTGVEIREFREREGEKTFISADIVVERNSQKGILIGKKGEALKRVGGEARKEIDAMIDHEVYLDLHVRVGKNWRRSAHWLRRLGYADHPADPGKPQE